MATEYTTNEYQCAREGGDGGREWRPMEAEMERGRGREMGGGRKRDGPREMEGNDLETQMEG